MLVKSGEGKMQVLACVGQKMYFTSQSREDLVVMKVAMLVLVKKLGLGTAMVSISISLGSRVADHV